MFPEPEVRGALQRAVKHPPSRLPWVDAARALCVVGIVLMHFWIWVYGPTADRYSKDLGGWLAITDVMLAFRMPLLFALSGLLVSSRVRNGWSDRRNLVRVANSYYLYAVWLTVYAVISVVVAQPLPYSISSPRAYLSQLVRPDTPLWFIFFLAVNVALLTTLRRISPALIMIALVGVSMWALAYDFPPSVALMGRGLYYMLFFAVGVYLRPIMISLASGSLWWKIPIAIMIFVWVTRLFPTLDYLSYEWLIAYIARDLSAIAVGISGVAALCYVKPLTRLLQYVGQRTLAVYVLHLPIIWGILLLTRLLSNETIDNAPLRLIAPLIASIAIVAVSIIVATALQRSSWGRVLFDIPSVVKNRLMDGVKA
ncbi:acyltransferase family protein [Microbacterium sp. M3]|uniref:Acyltransferase family protein n=1 Tax=Microbacterium arthrosphaerae TaxID=792652 RepID=A0ABU4H3N1_9MICO|nr:MULTISPECIES: acyltransferase family protein [Microbacterium]MDW4573870.1 acyltransferase family protein [Microbacterium arthrosphaerae]MDW7607725.1 acyltransferase family protein [Microbacterium sp. M3]